MSGKPTPPRPLSADLQRRLEERERRMNLVAEARARFKAEQAALERRMAETEALAQGRGETVRRARGGALEIEERRDGLQKLKERMDRASAGAAEQYRALYRVSRMPRHAIRSSLNLEVKGPPGERFQERAAKASETLGRLREHLTETLGRSVAERLIEDLDEVCGEGRSLWSLSKANRYQAGVREGLLIAGLGAVASYWRIG